MKLLILGGTADARHLATAIHQAQPCLELLYSVAGLVRQPQVPATVVSGGFSQFGGLTAYCQQQNIDGIVNTTHPFSVTMGDHAQQACKELGLDYWRFLRPQWQQQSGDDWRLFSSTSELFNSLTHYQRILLTLGQVSPEELALFNPEQQIWLRTAVRPTYSLPDNVTWIKAIGPFDEACELSLLKQHNITAIASKNSGGSSTIAKLSAARSINIPVFMLQRPNITGPAEEDFDVLVERLNTWAKTTKAPKPIVINKGNHHD
ncbi:MAG: precorrin-6A/cobalt-precorrin-6A reductase [Gammaproteobacteria bacterium]|nr:precorrin-6A/cobalt-precorrin-6A reductase [Gammaproteobacteria bacterium]